MVVTLVEMSDGATLRTWASADLGQPAIVFLHGGPGMWDYLGPVADMLADRFRTVRYDQRGCGRSGSNTDQRVARHVADLDELRAHLGHDRWAVLGHSFGALLGLHYAAAHPERVTGLVHSNGVGLDWPVHKREHEARAAARFTPDQRARLTELEGRDRSWDEEVEWRMLCWLPDFVNPADAAQAAGTPIPINLTANRTLSDETKTWTRTDERALCSRVIAPVLVVHGTEDPRPIDGPRSLVTALPSPTLVEIDGAGHQPWHERPEEFRDVLRHFLTSLPKPEK